MSKRIFLSTVAVSFVLSLAFSAFGATNSPTTMRHLSPIIHSVLAGDSDRDRDGLIGPVRRIKTESAKLTVKSGQPVEGQRVQLETAAYDIKGNKVENAYFPVAGGATLTGREVYKYDDKGNISEMTLLASDGSLVSKETYSYDYDFVGNWTKMTTSVAVIEAGKLSFEPTEVTYRTISYYLDESLTRMMQGPQPNGAQPAQASNNNAAGNTVGNNAVVPPASNQPANGSSNPASNPGSNPAQNPANAARKGPELPPASSSTALNRNVLSGPSNSSSAPAGGSADKNAVVMDSEPPSGGAPKPLLRPISGGVLNGKAVALPAPDYPDMAKRTRVVGLVVVEVVIDTNGKVISAKAVSGHPMLQLAAVQAANRARFSPTTLSGQPVRISGVINYNFSLAK